MNKAKGLIVSAVRLILAPFQRMLDADSDWVRYGLPAILLTGIFFVAMRFSDANVESPHPSSVTTASVKSLLSAPLSLRRERDRIPMSEGHSPGSGTVAQAIPEPLVHAPLSRFAPATPPAGDPHWADGLSEQDREARRAVCEAARRVNESVKRGKHRKNRAFQIAISGYRGGGDVDIANRVVTKAIDDYGRNIWSEEKCNPGQVLSKGSIGATFR
jgi:hypothetical protein